MERRRRDSSAAQATAAAGSASAGSAECWDSISYLESAFHHAFMRGRVTTGEFVYHDNPRLTRELDEFCDVDAMHQRKGPILLLGASGVGKSAFLANWLVRRKKMFQSGGQAVYPEFTFYHVVGCSRQSCFVSNLLERILRELKESFELSKEIPAVEERLGWQLPRFLEAAAKKGRVILVVDGLQRLRTSNGESILKWIPLAFPPNVRIVFTGTTDAVATEFAPGGGSDGSSAAMESENGASANHECAGSSSEHRHEQTSVNALMIERIKLEAIRRKWTCVHVPSLTESDRLSIVRMFLRKHMPVVVGTASLADQISGWRAESVEPGLQLLELQEKVIVAVPMTASPHFLKVFLGCLAWAADAGFNINDVFESWLSAKSISALIEAILRSMESGYSPTQQGIDDAHRFLAENGHGSREPHENQKLTADIKSTTNKHQLSAAMLSASAFERTPRAASRANELTSVLVQDLSEPAAASSSANLKCAPLRRSASPSRDERFSGSNVSSLTRIGRAEETRRVFVSTLRSDVSRARALPMPSSAEFALASTSSLGGAVSSLSLLSSPSSPVRSAASPSRQHLHMLARPKSDLPAYLSGGRQVSPLGKLLGHAFCLLYVCRHGLLTNELRFVLNAVAVEEGSAVSPHRKAPFARGRGLDKQPITSFSDLEWRSLLRAIKQLGVLFVHDVIVLPICKEALRDVVWWRYVGSESREQRYHKWLIRFFRFHPTTFRRVEELPWHLQRCFHWDALRTELVNLAMFQLLYTATYKHELFGYWKTLTDGPLLNFSSVSSDPTAPTYVQPFDVVREYSRSVEDWYKSARLPTKTFTPVVELVTKFMFEFALAYQGRLPDFRYAPLDLRRLHEDGFAFAKALPHAQPPSTATAASQVGDGSSMTVSASTSATTALVAALDGFPALGQAGSTSVGDCGDAEAAGNGFYFYQRWVWIHFPWLALGKEIAVREPSVTSTSVAGGAPGDTLGNSGPMQRHWSSRDAPLSSAAVTVSVDGEEQGLTLAVLATNSVDARTSSKAAVCSWGVKLLEPSSAASALPLKKAKGVASPSKIAALQNASAWSHAPATRSEDVISPESLFSKKATHLAVKNVLSSSVRRLPTAVASASLPLATISETTDGDDERWRRTMLGEADERDAETKSALQSTRDLVVERLSVNDTSASPAMAFGLPAHFQDYPQTEWDLKQSHNRQVVLRFQTLYDATKAEVARKQAHLQRVKSRIQETTKRYELSMRDCEMAKRAIGEMSDRMDRIDTMVSSIDEQEKRRRKLLRGCELFPACDPSHLDTVKKELKLLQTQLQDLTEERKVLHLKKTRLQSTELPLLRSATDKSKALMSAIVEKLEKAREKMAQDHAATEMLYQRRLEMIATVHSATVASTDTPLEEDQAVALLAASTTTRSLAATAALQQCESMVEKIQKATGYSKLELILEKFVSREELNRSFAEQAKAHEARLKQIKHHRAELDQQLKTLEESNATVTMDDPRVLEERLRIAELELSRVERTHSSLLTTSKDVIAGTSRVVKLIGITSCRSPYEDAIPALQLWPPTANVGSESSLLLEFESLGPKEIAELLCACQERASLMIDAVEIGRGDPDAKFTAKQSHSPHKSARVKAKCSDVRFRKDRAKKTPSSASSSENQERTFDRGSIASCTFDGSVSIDLQTTEEGENESSDDDDGPETRECLKEASRGKVLAKKRASRASAHIRSVILS